MAGIVIGDPFSQWLREFYPAGAEQLCDKFDAVKHMKSGDAWVVSSVLAPNALATAAGDYNGPNAGVSDHRKILGG
jgi:hypothetical protein